MLALAALYINHKEVVMSYVITHFNSLIGV